jgi:hypothetical protein
MIMDERRCTAILESPRTGADSVKGDAFSNSRLGAGPTEGGESDFIKRRSVMGFYDRIEKMNRRERTIRADARKMRAGETWICPIELQKGVDYSFFASADSGTNIKCSLFNGEEAPVAQSEVGAEVSLSVAPDEDGLHRLMIETLPDGPREPKVALTVRKAYVPSRVRAWSYPPMD